MNIHRKERRKTMGLAKDSKLVKSNGSQQLIFPLQRVPSYYATVLFYDISTKYKLITMNHSVNKLVQMTHPSCNFHQLSLNCSWDIAKYIFLYLICMFQVITQIRGKVKSEEFSPKLFLKYVANSISLEDVPDLLS